MMACAGAAAYVLDGCRHVLTEYKTGEEPRVIAMPAEIVDLARKNMESNSETLFTYGYNNLFLAEDGRLVVEIGGLYELAGAVVDPMTGCYALLHHKPRPPGWTFVGMFGDSVVTLEGNRRPATRTVRGRQVAVYDPTMTHVFVRPVRAVSGEPCSPRRNQQGESATRPSPARLLFSGAG